HRRRPDLVERLAQRVPGLRARHRQHHGGAREPRDRRGRDACPLSEYHEGFFAVSARISRAFAASGKLASARSARRSSEAASAIRPRRYWTTPRWYSTEARLGVSKAAWRSVF